MLFCLSAFYSHRRFTEEIDSSLEESIIPDDFTTDTYGIGYTRRYISLQAERSERKSIRNSSEVVRVSGTFYFPLSAVTTVSGGASESWIESTGEEVRDTSLFKAEGKVNMRLSKYLEVSGDVDWRNEDSSDRGRTRGLTMGVALEYDRSAFSVSMGWDSYLLEQEDSETLNTDIYFRVIRRF